MKAFFLALILLAQQPDRIHAGAVTGRLLLRNGMPAAGIRVAAMPVPSEEDRAAAPVLVSIGQTDDEGDYRLEDVPPGRYFVVAGLIDYPSYYPGAAGLDGATAVEVDPGATVEGIDFGLVRSTASTVSGRISGPETLGVGPSWLVTLTPVSAIGRVTGGMLQASPDTSGVFIFPQVPRGEYRLTSPTPGSSFIDVSIGDDDVRDVVLPVADCDSGVEVRGRLVGDPSSPVQNVIVTGSKFRCRAQAPVTADGFFTLRNVPEDSYAVQLTPAPVGWNGLTVAVGDRPVSSLDIAMPALVELRGRILVEDGGVVPTWSRGVGVSVQARGIGNNVSAAETVDGQGTFRLRLLAGRYRISVPALPPNYYVKAVTDGGLEILDDSLEVQVPAVTDIRITVGVRGRVRPGFRVSGRVIPPGGGALASPEGVLLVSSTGGRSAASLETAIDDDGGFEFLGVQPGRYALQTVPDSPVFLRDVVVRGDVTGIEFALPVLFKVNGAIEWIDESGIPAPGLPGDVSVQFLKQDRRNGDDAGLRVWSALAQSGAFQAYLPEGEYRFSITGLPRALRIKSVDFGAADLAESALRVTSSLDPMNLRVTVEGR